MIKAKDVSNRIVDLMKEYDYSVYKLSELSGVPYSTARKIVKGISIPQVDTLEQICNAFGMSVVQFFTDDGETVDYIARTESEKDLLIESRSLTPSQHKEVVAFIKGIKIK